MNAENNNLRSITSEILFKIISYKKEKNTSSNPLEVYQRRITKEIKELKYCKNISIKKIVIPEKNIPLNLTSGTKSSGLTRYILTILNLEIKIIEKESLIEFNRDMLGDYVESNIINRIPLVIIDFNNCKFIHSTIHLRQEVKFKIGTFTMMSFDNCKFIKLGIIITYITKKNDENKSINFSNNKFCESILLLKEELFDPADRHISDSRLNCTSILTVEDNVLSAIQICGRIDAEFSGVNKINEMKVGLPLPYIFWNPYQEINNESPNIAKSHKTLFLELKKDAKKNEDAFQASYFHNEVVKCEHEKIRLEDQSIAFQEIIILNWTKHISNYGTSWVKPIRILFLLNCISAFLILILMHINYSMQFNLVNLITITFELFIPFKWYSEILNDQNYIKVLSSFLNIFHKSLYAALIYEAVKSFRRFGGK